MKYDEEYVQSLDLNNQSENNSKPEKSGLIDSLISLLLYIFTFLPYIVVIVHNLIDAFIFNTPVYGFHLGVVLGGIIVFIPALLSCIWAIIAIKRYKKITTPPKKFRRILHILNIISLSTIGIFLFLAFVLMIWLIIISSSEYGYVPFLIVFIAILWQFWPKLIQLLKNKNK